jgi:hypothetical protein
VVIVLRSPCSDALRAFARDRAPDGNKDASGEDVRQVNADRLSPVETRTSLERGAPVRSA